MPKLAELEKQQRTQLNALEPAREQRTAVLASLEAESHTRAQNLERLKSQQAGLEKLLRELRAAMAALPRRGQRCLHAAARQARLARERAAGGALRRDARRRGEMGRGAGGHRARRPVKAVCQGSVIYADWLPGLGLLTIVDHGDGYLSLYGHNERLYKAVGERWRPGTRSPRPATAVAAAARSCISRSARPASRSIRAPGSRAGPLKTLECTVAGPARAAPARDVIGFNVLGPCGGRASTDSPTRARTAVDLSAIVRGCLPGSKPSAGNMNQPAKASTCREPGLRSSPMCSSSAPCCRAPPASRSSTPRASCAGRPMPRRPGPA